MIELACAGCSNASTTNQALAGATSGLLVATSDYYSPTSASQYLADKKDDTAGGAPFAGLQPQQAAWAASIFEAPASLSDRRACVTAAYLCVLIVNSSWLDCNLVGSLCNNQPARATNRGRSNGDPQALGPLFPAAGRQQQQQQQQQHARGPVQRPGAKSRGAPWDPPDPGSGAGQAPRSTAHDGSRKPARRWSWPPAAGAEHQSEAQGDWPAKQALFFGPPEPDEEPEPGAGGPVSDLLRSKQISALAGSSARLSAGGELRPASDAERHPDVSGRAAVSLSSGISWLLRPFRAWNSNAFWPESPASQDSSGGQADAPERISVGIQVQAAQLERPAPQPQPPQLQVQILRPTGDRLAQHLGDELASQLAANRTVGPFGANQQRLEMTSGALVDGEADESLHLVPIEAEPAPTSAAEKAASVSAAAADSGSDAGSPLADDSGQELRKPAAPPIAAGQTQYLLLRPFHAAEDCNCYSEPGDDAGDPASDCRRSNRCQPAANFAGAASQAGASGGAPAASPSLAKTTGLLEVSFFLYTRQLCRSSKEPVELSLASLPPAPPLGAPVDNSSAPAATSGRPGRMGAGVGLDAEAGLEALLEAGEQRAAAAAGPAADNFRLLNGSLPIKIVIHGFGSGGKKQWVQEMALKLLEYEDVNVVVVDWEKGATLPNYVQAAGNTRLVGHKIAQLIRLINARLGVGPNSYHLIGFSLGAHVAGFAGMEFSESTPHGPSRMWINRITGLDPASPLFEGHQASERLDSTDAQFVDVIHSNGDGVLRGGFGALQPMGHVDFYPNGGRVQLGCNSVLLSALSDIIYGKWQSLCNHRRALNFFMDSFQANKCKFRSFSCDSYESYLRGECFDCGHNNDKCSYMGYLANHSNGRGKMYLTTHEEAPFCANQLIVRIIGTRDHKSLWGRVEVTLVTPGGRNESFSLTSTNHGQQLAAATASSGLPVAAAELLGATQQRIAPGSGPTGHSGSAGSEYSSQYSMQGLVVAHLELASFTQVLLRYTRYKGWIYSGGDESWSIDKVLISDSEGQVKSYCGHGTVLEGHVTSKLELESGNCTLDDYV